MPRFRYTARTSTGEELHGELTAGDEAWARYSLESVELEIVALEPCDLDAAKAGEASAGAAPEELPRRGRAPRLNASQSAAIVSRVAVATSSGLPIEDTLEALAADSDDPRLAAAVRQLSARLRDGVPLEQATEMLQRQLPPRIRGLLEAGVRCGNPTAVFDAFVRQQIAARSVSRRLASSVAMPLLIVLFAALVSFSWTMFVLPGFESLFRDFALELPALTMVTLMLSHILPWAMGGLLAIMATVWLLARIGAGSALVCSLRNALPLVGRLWTWAGQQELASTLAPLVELRVPLPEALGYAANLLADGNLAQACRKVSAQAASGVPLSECMSRSIHFDRMLTSLVRWGEEHDLVAPALHRASDYFTDRIEQQSNLIRRTLPPVIMLMVVIAAGITLISLFIPLVKLIEGLT